MYMYIYIYCSPQLYIYIYIISPASPRPSPAPRKWGFEAVMTDGIMQGVDKNISKGFIIQNDDHFFAIRELHGAWWNLDSDLNAPVEIECVETLISDLSSKE